RRARHPRFGQYAGVDPQRPRPPVDPVDAVRFPLRPGRSDGDGDPAARPRREADAAAVWRSRPDHHPAADAPRSGAGGRAAQPDDGLLCGRLAHPEPGSSRRGRVRGHRGLAAGPGSAAAVRCAAGPPGAAGRSQGALNEKSAENQTLSRIVARTDPTITVMLAVWSGGAYVHAHKKYPRKGLSWARRCLNLLLSRTMKASTPSTTRKPA